MLVLLDTTILTNFARVGLTSVIRDLWGDPASTTADVLKEYETGTTAAGLPSLVWKQLRVLTRTPQEEILASTAFPRLANQDKRYAHVASGFANS